MPHEDDDTYGFLKISLAMKVEISSNSVTNHFFTYELLSLAANYGSFVTFSGINGYVDITDLTILNMTGVLGTYNVDTLSTIVTLSEFGNDVESYQFVPVITTDFTNNIIILALSGIDFKDSIGHLGGADYAGLLLNIQINPNTGYLDVQKVTINDLNCTNVYIYGQGGITYKYGDFEMTNSEITSFGLNQPMISTTVPENSPIINVIRHDHTVTYNNVTFTDTVGGTDGASIFINAEIDATVTAIVGNNIVMTDVTITGCASTGPIAKFSTLSLTGQITNFNANSNTNSVQGALYITGGGTLIFDNPTFTNNDGSTAADLNIETCTSCDITLNSGTFTRDAIDITEPVTYDKTRSIYINQGGTLTITDSTFSNYLLVVQGGVIEAHESIITITSSTFDTNSAGTGGAIYAETDVTLSLTDCTLSNNKAGTQAGVIFARINCVITTNNCILNGNEAPENAILSCFQNSGFNDNGSTFSSNTATDRNVLGSISQGPGSVFDGTTFSDNSVTGTGGILLYNLFNDITLRNVMVNNNVYADGIKNFYLISSTVVIEDSTFNVDTPGDVSTETARGGYVHLFG
jgi:predicted outer membrane repeat protein